MGWDDGMVLLHFCGVYLQLLFCNYLCNFNNNNLDNFNSIYPFLSYHQKDAKPVPNDQRRQEGSPIILSPGGQPRGSDVSLPIAEVPDTWL